jgi:ABC-type phosphate transport system substrate-binding protein
MGVDWSAVFGAVPTIGGGKYPLCTLTYVIGWTHSKTAGLPEGTGNVVHEYVRNYLLSEEGQKIVDSHYYAPLPNPANEANNVLEAAQFSAEQIGE